MGGEEGEWEREEEGRKEEREEGEEEGRGERKGRGAEGERNKIGIQLGRRQRHTPFNGVTHPLATRGSHTSHCTGPLT